MALPRNGLPARRDDFAKHLPDLARVRTKGLNRRVLPKRVPVPEAARSAEGRDAALGRNAGPGQGRDRFVQRHQPAGLLPQSRPEIHP